MSRGPWDGITHLCAVTKIFVQNFKGRYCLTVTNNTESPHLLNIGVLLLKITAYSDMTQTGEFFLIIVNIPESWP